jgi:glycosyltransferase involved in cell wall biosynthesis
VVKLAVFTSKYPARVATFFERDLRGLIAAGIDVEVFAIYPLDERMWRYATLDENRLPRDRVHHLSSGEALAGARHGLRRVSPALGDAFAVLASSARNGPVPFAKTAYVLPKAWTWAMRHAERFDHVLAYWGNYAGTCAYAFHRLMPRRVPFSLFLHAGTDLYRTQPFLRRKLVYADEIFTCCRFNRSYILQRFGDLWPVISGKLHVHHHGLDLDEFPYRPGGRPERRVVAVGRLAAHKGFDYLLRAAHLLGMRGVKVMVELVGDGEERQKLRQLADDFGIADRVSFRGWVPFDGARRAIAEATLLVHPSEGLGDGLPNVVVEAMALGTPVVASRVAGLPEALEGGCGVLVTPRDVVELADVMERLFADAYERRAIAERARARIEERFDLWRNGVVMAGRLANTRRRGVPNGPDLVPVAVGGSCI